MIKKEKLIFSLIFVLLIFHSKISFAQTGEAGAAGAYLRVGVGARPLSMGGAYVGIKVKPIDYLSVSLFKENLKSL